MAKGNSYGYKSTTSFYQTDYTLGEVGDKIGINKDSQIYYLTANRIINLIPTETGSLRMLRKMKPKVIQEDIDIQQVINTKYNFYILITTTGIATVDKITHTIKNKYDFGDSFTFTRNSNGAVLIDKFLLVPVTNGTTTKRLDYEINSDGRAGINADFANSIRNPIKNRGKVKVDIYQVRNMLITESKKELRAFKVSTTENQEFSVEEKLLKFRYNTDLNLTRIFYPYRTDLVNVTPMEAQENEYFVSIYDPETVEGGKWYLGNQEITFDEKTNDTTGTYYKKVTLGEGTLGKTQLLNFGLMKSLNNDTAFQIALEYQNRMIVSDGSYIYFSRVGDYNYFLNDSGTSDAFFIKLSNVNGEEPRVLKMIAGRGIWVITDKGIFLLGYNQVITGATIDVRLITDDSATTECQLVGNSLYYLTTDNELKCIQNITSTKGYVDFDTYFVDKFFSTDDIVRLSEHKIDNKKYLLASLKNSTRISEYNVGAYLYSEVKTNSFSRVSVEFPQNCIGFDTSLFAGNSIYTLTENNMRNAYLKLNAPPVTTTKYGNLRNDTPTMITRLTMKLFEEQGDSVNNVKLSGIYASLLGETVQGVYNVYTVVFSKNLKDAMYIELETKENTEELEIQATEIEFKPGEE